MTGTRGKNKSDTIMTCNLSLHELRQNLGPSLVAEHPLYSYMEYKCRPEHPPKDAAGRRGWPSAHSSTTTIETGPPGHSVRCKRAQSGREETRTCAAGCGPPSCESKGHYYQTD